MLCNVLCVWLRIHLWMKSNISVSGKERKCGESPMTAKQIDLRLFCERGRSYNIWEMSLQVLRNKAYLVHQSVIFLRKTPTNLCQIASLPGTCCMKKRQWLCILCGWPNIFREHPKLKTFPGISMTSETALKKENSNQLEWFFFVTSFSLTFVC